MDTKSDTATRAELDSTEVGALLLRLFEITRELRGDHATTLHSLTAIEEIPSGDRHGSSRPITKGDQPHQGTHKGTGSTHHCGEEVRNAE